MIEIGVKIHDKFSIEFKVGFVVRRKVKQNDFAINTWIFVPNSLDINPMTYSKSQFYKDTKSNVRLITPIFLLRDIVGGAAVPLKNIETVFDAMASTPTRTLARECEYQIKMFTAIFKSALRDELNHIVTKSTSEDVEYLCRSFIQNVQDVTTQYRELRKIINAPTVPQNVINYFTFGDEFMSNIIEQHTFKMIDKLSALFVDERIYLKEELSQLIVKEIAYKRDRGYLVVAKDSPNSNRELVFRHGILKKYVESDLFLKARKKKDGVIVEQVYYSLAAGLSMIFATAIAFSFQLKYGNFTMPLFVALVVSYMLKDRIKELMRYYFAHRLGAKYFDNKTTISIKDEPIGWSKEGVDFITEDKTPREIMDIRSRSPLLEAENQYTDEKILLYRKLVRIDRDKLELNSPYSIAGINDILRFNINSFIQKMDNPEVPLYSMDGRGDISVINGQKIYYLNFLMQFQFEDQIDYKRFRIVFNRTGIIDIEHLK